MNEPYKIDKSSCPEGEWNDGPDGKDWVDGKSRYVCRISRSRFQGHLCGYVGVAVRQPMFGMDFFWNKETKDV